MPKFIVTINDYRADADGRIPLHAKRRTCVVAGTSMQDALSRFGGNDAAVLSVRRAGPAMESALAALLDSITDLHSVSRSD